MRHLFNSVRNAFKRSQKTITTAAVIAAGVVGSQAHAATASIPDTGIDVAGYVQSGILAIGAVVGVCVGGYFGFLVIKRALKWAGHALG